MNTVLLISSLLVFVWFVINQHIKQKRFKHLNNLSIIYDKMEIHFVRNEVTLSDRYIEFLKVFKNLVTNPGYLDIQVLISLKLISDQQVGLNNNTDWFDKTLGSLGDDFQELVVEFHHNA